MKRTLLPSGKQIQRLKNSGPNHRQADARSVHEELPTHSGSFAYFEHKNPGATPDALSIFKGVIATIVLASVITVGLIVPVIFFLQRRLVHKGLRAASTTENEVEILNVSEMADSTECTQEMYGGPPPELVGNVSLPREL
jgi:hypothetical protein